MNKLVKPALIVASIAFINACASKAPLTEVEVLNKYKPVVQLEKSINDSDQTLLALLSQESFKQAVDALGESKELAVKDNYSAIDVATRGESYFKQAQANAEKAKDIFSDVLEARAQAISGGALTQSPLKMAELEEEFKKMTSDLERGEIESAKIRRPIMAQRYMSLELTSLKKATVDNAKQHLTKAKSAGAQKYAGKTYEMAKNELALATSMLDADKSSKAKADEHAAKAIWLSDKSVAITDMVKEFRANDFSLEDIVLWHQSQLGKAVKPLNMELPLNLTTNNLSASVALRIDEIVKANKALTGERDSLALAVAKNDKQLKQAFSSSESELTALKTRYEGEKKQRDQVALQNRKKLEFIQGLFKAEEANVYREKDDILIRAQGFHFASGQSEIDSRNFAILQKIASAIGQYPDAKIVVTGHTDSSGNDAINLNLSKQRAEKVAKFLNEVGGISLERLTSEGFGEQKPVATNDTSDGRSANRRVEVFIVNKS